MSGKIVRSGHDLVHVPSKKGKQECFALGCHTKTEGRVVVNSDGVMNELPACSKHGGDAVDDEE